MDDVRDRVGRQTWKNNSGEDFCEARPARAFVPPPAADAADLEQVGVLSVGRDRRAGAEEGWERRVSLGVWVLLSKSGSSASARVWTIDDEPFGHARRPR